MDSTGARAEHRCKSRRQPGRRQRSGEPTVVKAFNTIHFRRLLEDSRPDLRAGRRLAIPIAGDDAGAKHMVINLIGQIGFTGMDAGTLAETRRQQPGSPLYLAYAESRSRQAPAARVAAGALCLA